MLEEHEWEVVHAELQKATLEAKFHRKANQTDLGGTPLERIFRPALEAYERITGFRDTNANALYHHRVALYGPPCRECGKPLRTPQARLCGACMAPRDAV